MATSPQRLPVRPLPTPRGVGAGLVARLRAAAATTPGRMRSVSLGVVACVALAWAVGFFAVAQRQAGIHTVGTDAEPVVVTSQDIQSLMSGADASSANSFLAGGVEPADQRARYLADVRQAQDDLAKAAAGTGTTARAQSAIATMAESAASYAGLVESARANNRQGFPVGAAYLRQAHSVVSATVIPAAGTLHQEAVDRLSAGYATAAGSPALAAAVVAALVLLTALVAAQVFLRRRTKRVLNVGMVAASSLAVVLAGWTLFSLITEGSQVHAARDRASALNVLAQARVSAFSAKTDESFALLAHGNGAPQYRDFDSAVAALGTGSGTGLLAQATQMADTADEQTALANATSALKAYLAVHATIVQQDAAGNSTQAIATSLATGAGTSNAVFDTFDGGIQHVADLTQQEFAARVTSAGHHLAGVAIGTSIGFILVAVLVLYGFQQRIKEYQ